MNKNNTIFIFFFSMIFVLLGAISVNANEAQQKNVNATNKLEKMQYEIEILQSVINKETQESIRELAQNKEAFLKEYEKIKKQKQELEANLTQLQNKFEEQTLLINSLEMEFSHQKNSRKALEGAVKINGNLLKERLVFAPYGSLSFIDHEVLQKITSEKNFPTFTQIDSLLSMLLSEIRQNGKIDFKKGTIYSNEGVAKPANILYAGGFFAVANDEDGNFQFLRPSDDSQKLMVAPVLPNTTLQKNLSEFFMGNTSLLYADLSKGAMFAVPKEERNFFTHIVAGGALVWPIILCGIFAGIFGIWRLYCLFRINLGAKEVFEKFYDVIGEGKFEEAKLLLEKHKTEKIMPYSFLEYMLTHWNNSVVSLEKVYEEAMNVFVNPLSKGMTFVAVCAAVAPLLGLLGTVTGMISTFDVITLYGNSDPKMLSGGISVALVTTELGLMVAIPLMFLHFFISRRVEVIEQYLDTKASMCIARASGFLVQTALTGYDNGTTH